MVLVVSTAGLIVEGTVVEITDGIQIRYPDETMTQQEANGVAAD